MPDAATPRSRDVSIGVTGSFGRSSSAIFGGPVTFFRLAWFGFSQVTYWGITAYAQVSASDPSGGFTPPLLHGPDPGAQPAGTAAFWLTIIRGAAVKIQKFYVPAPATWTPQSWTAHGSYTLSESVHCAQRVNPEPYEVRTVTDFTMAGSVDITILDTGGGSSTSGSSPSVTMTAAEAAAAGIGLGTPSGYAYSFAFTGTGLGFSPSAGISFSMPGLTSAYSGIATASGNAHLNGGGASCSFDWVGGEGTINPAWNGSTVPAAQIDIEGSWAMSMDSHVYHYRDGSEVGATVDHYIGTHLAGSFGTGGVYRYPGSGLIHWLQLNSFSSGANTAGTGFQPGVPADYPITGSDYGPVAHLLNWPGETGAETLFLFNPTWANGYGTYTAGPLHPIPAPALRSKVLPPYQQGTIQWDATHRFGLFESMAPGTLTTTTADVTSDSLFPVVSTAGFTVGSSIVIEGYGTSTIASLDAAAPSITTTATFAFVPAGTVLRQGTARWAAAASAPTWSGAGTFDPTPAFGIISGSGIDGGALQVTTDGSAYVTTGQNYLLHHQGYRYARLRLAAPTPPGGRCLLSLAGYLGNMEGGEYGWLVSAPTAKLAAAVAAGDTFLPLDGVHGFEVGQQVSVGAGGTAEVLTVVSVASGGTIGIGVTATAHAHGALEPVSLTGGQWYTGELDLGKPSHRVLRGMTTWETTTDLVAPAEFAPDPVPFGQFFGAAVSVVPLDAGTYAFDWLEGYHQTDGARDALILFPFLDGQGDKKSMPDYDDPDVNMPSPDDPIEELTWVTNGMRGATVSVLPAATSVTLFWSHLAALYDTAANDTGIHILAGTAGDPDPLMVFLPTGAGQFAFDLIDGYGVKPAEDSAYLIHGQLRSDNVAYPGAGDLSADSGGYSDTIQFHADWLFDGEAIIQTGAAGVNVTLNDNESEDVLAAATSDDDGMARLGSLLSHYGVVKPYDNLDGSAEFFPAPPPPSTTISGPYVLPGDTDLPVVDETPFAVGDMVLLAGVDTTTITAISPGHLIVATGPTALMNPGDTVAKIMPLEADLAYTALGLNLNSDWLSGSITPKDAGGYWARGTPPGRVNIVILDRYQTFLTVLRALVGKGVWNMHDRLGGYHRADVSDGKIRYHRSDLSLPPFAVEADATAGPADSEPRMSMSGMDRIHLLFSRDPDVMLTWSDDDGATWSEPMSLFTGGKHPANAPTDIGTVIHAAYVSGQIQAKEEFAPEQWSAPWTFEDASGAALAFDDDSFSFSLAKEGAARHVLVATAGGNVSEWVSADDARTWEPVTP